MSITQRNPAPGPWSYDYDYGFILDADGTMIAGTIASVPGQELANGKTLAAAREMRDALQAVMVWHNAPANGEPVWPFPLATVLDALEKAGVQS